MIPISTINPFNLIEIIFFFLSNFGWTVFTPIALIKTLKLNIQLFTKFLINQGGDEITEFVWKLFFKQKILMWIFLINFISVICNRKVILQIIC